MQQTIKVTGMTCQNCVRHVTEALKDLPGVRSAQADLATGDVRLDAERAIPREELSSALDEAGYALA